MELRVPRPGGDLREVHPAVLPITSLNLRGQQLLEGQAPWGPPEASIAFRCATGGQQGACWLPRGLGSIWTNPLDVPCRAQEDPRGEGRVQEGTECESRSPQQSGLSHLPFFSPQRRTVLLGWGGRGPTQSASSRQEIR
jgi:hypothetical protein